MNKIVIIGAGSGMFSKKLICDVLTYDDMEIDAIGLVDINEHKLHIMEQVADRIVKQLGKHTVIEASTERRDVLKNAKYVINTIGVGGVEIYEKDLEIPEKYGCIQNVGDIIGPGGMFRGLRAFPSILAMCKDMGRALSGRLFFQLYEPHGGPLLSAEQSHKDQSLWILSRNRAQLCSCLRTWGPPWIT